VIIQSFDVADPPSQVVTGPRGGYIDGRKWKLAKGKYVEPL
jgi:hypothetical protein